MDFYEELPPNCPPDEAQASNMTYFRLGSIPPDDSDFWSHRRRFPHKKFHVSECVARSLSVFDDLEAANHLKHLLPTMRTKPIFQINLSEKDGLIQQTGMMCTISRGGAVPILIFPLLIFSTHDYFTHYSRNLNLA
jgi:hypothetical protein